MDITINTENIYNTTIKAYDDYIYKHSLLVNKLWDAEIVDEILQNLEEDSDILDIGANIGLVTLGLLKRLNEGTKKINTIHCFECNPNVIPLLISNVSPFNNVKVYPFALSNTQELFYLTNLDYNIGSNFIYSSNNDKIKREYDYSSIINTETHTKNNNTCLLGVSLDSIKYSFNNKISVIKIDVEGYELNVLQGMTELIQLHRPIIITEIFESINFNNVISFFEKMNYVSYRKIINTMYRNEDYIFYPKSLK